MKTVTALVRKDLLLHWRGMVLLSVGMGAFVVLLLWLFPPRERQGVVPVGLLAMLVNFNLAFATWLVDRERSRETFALLRAMPVSDRAIVTSKFITHGLLGVTGFGVMLAVYPRLLGILTPPAVVTLLITFLMFGALVVGLRLCLPERPGTIAPLVVLLVLAIVGARLSQEPQVVALYERVSMGWSYHAAIRGIALLVSGGIWYVTVRCFQSRETRDLLTS
jgi:hypothetical protein